MKEGVFYASIFGFSIGIFLRSFILIGNTCVLFFLLLSCSIVVIAWIEKRYSWIVVAIFFFAFSFGVLRMQSATLLGNGFLNDHLETSASVRGIVSAEPDMRNTSIHLTIHTEDVMVASTSKKVNIKIIASVPPHTNVLYGDEVEIFGTLATIQNFETSLGRPFNYVGYEASNGIGYSLKNAQIKILSHGHGNYIIRNVLFVK